MDFNVFCAYFWWFFLNLNAGLENSEDVARNFIISDGTTEHSVLCNSVSEVLTDNLKFSKISVYK